MTIHHGADAPPSPPPTRTASARPLAALSAVLVVVTLAFGLHGVTTGAAPAAGVTSWRDSVAPVALVDAAGAVWSGASHFSGGTVRKTARQAVGTGSPRLYAYYRQGVSRYVRDVARPGLYALNFFFHDPLASAPGERVFDVVVNGRVVARHFDVFRVVGANGPAHLLVLVPVTTGRIVVVFHRVAGRPLVSAIQGSFIHSSLTMDLRGGDDFNGPAGAAPSTMWRPDVGGSGWGNHQLEYDTGRPANAHLDGRGHLAIVGRHGRYTGSDGVKRYYTSARLTTQHSFTFTYGIATARMRLPTGKGLWPAFWALGADIDKVGWPGSGEIDVVESAGHVSSESAWLHFPIGGVDGRLGGTSRAVHSSRAFADYSVMRTPIGIQTSINGVQVSSIAPADLPAGAKWVFDRPFYLVLNLAIGGWVGAPTRATRFPAVMLVDNVHVYE